MQSIRLRTLSWLCLLGFIVLSGCSSLAIAVSPKVTQADLQKMKKVALQLEASSSSSSGSMFGGFQMIGGHQGSQEAFADHFAVELLKLGIDVIERAQLDKVMREQALNLGGVTDSTAQTIAVGKILAVDALIIGTVGTGQNYSYGFMGFGGGIREVVSSASIRIIDVEKGNWMLIITLSGGSDSIRDTAESFAKALKQKLEAT